MSREIHPTVSELRAARETVKDALTSANVSFPLETDVSVELGWDGSDFVTREVDGAAGYADYPDTIEISFNTHAEEWQASLASTAAHEHAHLWCFEQRGREADRKWEYVLEEAFTQHVAARLVPEYDSPWWTRHGEPVLAEYWPAVRDDEFDAENEDGGPLFIDPEPGGYPHGYGYSLAYRLGEELLNEESYGLQEFVAVDREELVAVGDRLFGE
ncbi:DUF2268 domain-containing protein [Haloarchaeobius sp. HME9146]|uniref:DUF2268 domain-containing protein n=1 Tax=Haloarchaeobius sp. HME9146 TaxID=2978732 RepID=UPI0021BEC0A2|nr:DUF2268 domain-containing protein [Haloarchaeobius sp. HME9146]MCT9094851.1 DUF2268 domain-containing protein [Haloarchaeobius sp. HME9146]